MFIYALMTLALAAGEGDVAGGGGWLGRLVSYHRHRFAEELSQLAPLQIHASVERAPPGYRDAAGWSPEAAVRLAGLLAASSRARPAAAALRRALRPSRRLYGISVSQSYKYFPSLAKLIPGGVYYDGEYESDQDSSSREGQVLASVKGGVPVAPPPAPLLDDNTIIRVHNPVEARLPSALISVRLLRDILEARGAAARVMPTARTPSTVSTIKWNTIKSGGTTAALKEAPAGPPSEPSAKPTDSPPAKGPGPSPADSPDPPPTKGPEEAPGDEAGAPTSQAPTDANQNEE